MMKYDLLSKSVRYVALLPDGVNTTKVTPQTAAYRLGWNLSSWRYRLSFDSDGLVLVGGY